MAGDARFFGSSGKRGDLQELREELHSTKLDKKRDAVRKVIANMTLGKDVSSLFADVLNCMQTQSLDLKKLVYLYVVNYSATQPELAILAVNTFRKDSVDPNPLIRALAVRTMGCIRLDAVTEYILEPLRRSCQDSDPYVRKTAVMCIAKLYDIQPELVEEHGFSEILKDLLTDSNPAVVANCVATLSEMSKRNPAFLQLTDQSIQNLLNALNECSEWAQALILDSISHSYHPPTPRAAEAILERVSPRLSHANQAVALSTVRLFLRFSDLLGQQESSRLMRKVGPPLVTLLHAESEIQFVVLRSLNLILRKKGLAAVLNMDVKIFFCKYNDPVFVKLEKLELLALLVGEGNLEVVLSEMRDYANEIDVEFVRKTIRTIGRIAIKFPQAAEPCINLLLELMKTSNGEYVTQESFVVVANIFRRYPGEYEAVIQTLCENLESIDEPEGKAAIIWVLGEYSERIDNAAEILEHFLTHFHDEPAQVRCVLLTGVVKLFLKSPGTATQQMVTRTLKLCTEETDDPDLRDRGYMYWRLLSSDPKVTKEVVLGTKPKISDDSGRLPPKMLETLIHGVGTLSSVYRQLPDTFLAGLAA
ncbi:unnamed protein product [Amoebophrya sp. A25]|nr:unnamed protein product [Amoebophrya sp. A25]|eukprot:GSA25T00003050001.1